jgi:hypothetical protein
MYADLLSEKITDSVTADTKSESRVSSVIQKLKHFQAVPQIKFAILKFHECNLREVSFFPPF